MKRTTAPNSVGGLHVDKVPGVTVGTTGIAEDRNNVQEEICNAIEDSGLTLSGADQTQLYQAIVALSHQLGEPVFNMLKIAPSVHFPAVRVDDADHDIDEDNWPDLVAALRAQKLESDGQTDFAVNVAAGVATFANAQPENRLLAALAEENAVHGSYNGWLSLNLGGTDYTITNVNAAAHTVTVSNPPGNGAYTAIVYPWRKQGDATQARLRRMSARALVGTQAQAGDTTAELLAGLRRRDRMQGHWHQLIGSTNAGADGGGQYSAINTILTAARAPISDGTNGTPRTGTTTDPRSVAGYLYIWGRRWIP